ncbi:hypothetical protein EIP91_009193 [Steccherinum ochraceum]|uniref:Uncharacterized protein n=1 Tax=Steccherinum ochraceum TaxID=92696 RepID=A0A4R0R7C7_9APHY|nr:hypothetical protein EIP91_009193 [Steccherinum ochraceum]
MFAIIAHPIPWTLIQSPGQDSQRRRPSATVSQLKAEVFGGFESEKQDGTHTGHVGSVDEGTIRVEVCGFSKMVVKWSMMHIPRDFRSTFSCALSYFRPPHPQYAYSDLQDSSRQDSSQGLDVLHLPDPLHSLPPSTRCVGRFRRPTSLCAFEDLLMLQTSTASTLSAFGRRPSASWTIWGAGTPVPEGIDVCAGRRIRRNGSRECYGHVCGSRSCRIVVVFATIQILSKTLAHQLCPPEYLSCARREERTSPPLQPFHISTAAHAIGMRSPSLYADRPLCPSPGPPSSQSSPPSSRLASCLAVISPTQPTASIYVHQPPSPPSLNGSYLLKGAHHSATPTSPTSARRVKIPGDPGSSITHGNLSEQ